MVLLYGFTIKPTENNGTNTILSTEVWYVTENDVYLINYGNTIAPFPSKHYESKLLFYFVNVQLLL